MILAIIFLGLLCVLLAIGGLILTYEKDKLKKQTTHLDYRIKDTRYSVDYLIKRVEHLENDDLDKYIAENLHISIVWTPNGTVNNIFADFKGIPVNVTYD